MRLREDGCNAWNIFKPFSDVGREVTKLNSPLSDYFPVIKSIVLPHDDLPSYNFVQFFGIITKLVLIVDLESVLRIQKER